MLNEKILFFVPAPIFSYGLQVQFEDWGYRQVALADSLGKVMESLRHSFFNLLVIDSDAITEADLMAIGHLLQEKRAQTPIIFISKNPTFPQSWKQPLRLLCAYRWLPKPCHTDQLWQQVKELLPERTRVSFPK